MTGLPQRITALAPDPSRPGAVRILVDGRPFCTVHEEAAGDPRLAPGAPWDAERQQTAGLAADQEAAWRSVLVALERRDFATAELGRRLRQKGHPPEAVEYAIGRARQAGLLDDAAFALRFVETRAARGRGPARLRRDLLALGVDDRLIARALATVWPDGEAPEEMARALASRRAAQLRGVARPARLRRVVAYLSRRGFTGPSALRIAREVLREKAD